VCEPLLRETINKPINRPLDVDEVLLGDLPLWVSSTDNGRSQTLLSSLVIAQLSSMSVPLRLPAVRSDARGSVVLAGTLDMTTAFRKLGSRCTGTMLRWSFTSLRVDPRCSGLLRGLCVTALRRDPDLRGLLNLATSRIPGRILCQPCFPSRSLGSTAAILFLFRRPRMLTFSDNTRFSENSL